MSNRTKTLCRCECGCGQETYFNKLVELPIQVSVDGTKRNLKTARRVYVLPECKEDFQEEILVQQELERFLRAASKLNFIRRALMAQDVGRLTHAVNWRNRGFKEARKRAIRSAIVFSLPFPIARFVSHYWQQPAELSAWKRLLATIKRKKS